MHIFRFQALAVLTALLAAASTGRASFHFWGINEVYSNASGTVQFIEMATSSGFEQFLQFNQFTSSTQALTFDHSLAASTANKTFLMATPGYVAIPGLPVADFVFPVNNFFSVTGDTLTLVSAEGDGVHPPSITFTNGQLPTDGVRSMNFDFSLTQSNSPKNFAGVEGTVPEPLAAAPLGLLVVGSLRKRRRAARSSSPNRTSPG